VTGINRQCPTCNRLWTTEQFPTSLAQCLSCSKIGAKQKPPQFKRQDNALGLIFRSALPEELDWKKRAENVALSLYAIRRCLTNMLVALDRDTPQTKQGPTLPTNSPTQKPNIYQEPPWLWFTLPELGFPLLMDQYCRPLHPEIKAYMRKYVSNGQEWEEVEDEDCWGVNYTEPTAHMKAKIESILYTWGEAEQDEVAKQTPERERFSVPHASRDPRILKDWKMRIFSN